MYIVRTAISMIFIAFFAMAVLVANDVYAEDGGNGGAGGSGGGTATDAGGGAGGGDGDGGGTPSGSLGSFLDNLSVAMDPNYSGTNTRNFSTMDFGSNFRCGPDGTPTTTLLGELTENERGCSPDFSNIFSGFVCVYQEIVADIMSQIYCQFTHSLRGPLVAALTLFIAASGLMFLMGTLPLTAKEATMVLGKLILVFLFATESEYMIGVIYQIIMGILQEGVVMILDIMAGGIELSGPNSLFQRMDAVIAAFIASVNTSAGDTDNCQGGALMMFLSFTAAAPPIALMGVMMMFNMFMVLARAILGYLFSITGIMILVVLAPIFLSFALFRFTNPYFNKWVQHLLSFSLQVVIVMAFIGFVISMDLGEEFAELFDVARPYSDVTQVSGARFAIQDFCTICNGTVDPDTGEFTCAGDGSALDATTAQPDIMAWLGSRVIYLLILAYILESVLKAAPEVARILAGVNYAPTLGGTPYQNTSTALVGGGDSIAKGFSRGFKEAGGGLSKSVAGGFRGAFNAIGRR